MHFIIIIIIIFFIIYFNKYLSNKFLISEAFEAVTEAESEFSFFDSLILSDTPTPASNNISEYTFNNVDGLVPVTTSSNQIIPPKTLDPIIQSFIIPSSAQVSVAAPATLVPVAAPSMPLVDINILSSINLISQNYKNKTPYIEDTVVNTQLPLKQIIKQNIGLNQILIEYPKYYPITTNFDPQFNNYNNLIDGSSVSIINEILINTINKANQENPIIKFNSSLNQPKFLEINESDVIDFARYFISIMNSIATMGNSFTFTKVIPISKEQINNQVRLNFQISIIYNYPKSKIKNLEINPKDFPLLLNAVLLFEKIYQINPLTNSNQVNIYLETLVLIGLTNSGYLPGNYTNIKN